MAGKAGDKPPIFIGVAWPYANGGLHLGHIAGSLLPPDIFRRYMRMAGHDVLMVSGSDCHGTPILLKAEAEGRSPQDIVEEFHADHARALKRLDIGFDLFTRTTTQNHIEHVQEIFQAALAQGFIEKRTQQAPFDAKAGRFLPDRYVEGTCPHCETAGARGDQCDACGKTLDPQELIDPRSKLDPDAAITFEDTEHYFFLLEKLQPALATFVAQNKAHWRPNTENFTDNWLREGLRDRAITRDLTWGVPIPLDGYDDKRIYVWFEAVCGYFTAAVEWARRSADGDWDGVAEGAHVPSAPEATSVAASAGIDPPDAWQAWWCESTTRAYYFLGKDNIPFHTIIWPAILIAYNAQREADGKPLLTLPYDVPANEFLNLSGKQFSKSRGVSIAVHDVLDRFDTDAVRYYLAVNMPEQRDADWTWDDFLSKVNDELVGAIGNLVHRILSFTHKNVGKVPAAGDSPIAGDVTALIEACSSELADHLEAVRLKKGIRRLLEFAAAGNQVMQQAAPWKLQGDGRAAVLHDLLRLVKALTVFMAPYVPAAADKAWALLAEKGSVHDQPWGAATAPLAAGADLPQPEALFRKLGRKELPRIDDPAARGAPDGATTRKTPEDDPAGDGIITFDEFQRLDLRLATIRSVEPHPDADKLYVLNLDVGELGERQIVAGLREAYEPGELVGKTVAFIANLAPVKLRGVESQGMILAADREGVVAVLNPDRDLSPGARIR